MSPSLAARIEAIWQALSRQYSWQLVDDPQPLVARAVAHFAGRSEVSEKQICAVLVGYYNEQWYQRLQRQERRAAEELMAVCRQQARAYRLTDVQQEDLAYETVKRMIDWLDSVKDPKALLGFALVTLRRLAQDMLTDAREIVESDVPSRVLERFTTEALVADTVEQQLINEQMLTLFRKKLPNQLQLLAIVGTIMLDEKPATIARELNIPVAQVTLARSRALARLHADARFMEFCQSLRGNA